MGFFSRTTRKIVFWTYPRTSWQWDVLCVLILVFIFLTPKSWFENTQFRRTHSLKTIPVALELIGNSEDMNEVQARVRALTGRADVVVTALRPKYDETGKVVGYEVDIR
jgi:hypothetical protein